MPFITEEIWQRLPREHDTDSIMITRWPHMQKKFVCKKADSEMELLISIIQAIRNLRATWHVENTKEISVLIKAKKRSTLAALRSNVTYINRLARTSSLKIESTMKKPKHAAVAVIGDTEVFLPLEGIIDMEKEKKRIEEKFDALKSDLKRTEAKLKNKSFTSKAPAYVVQKVSARKEFLKTEMSSLKKNLRTL